VKKPLRCRLGFHVLFADWVAYTKYLTCNYCDYTTRPKDEYGYPKYDKYRPCKGGNVNVCVAEGCYDNACVRIALKAEEMEWEDQLLDSPKTNDVL
jgi:hypothetical protein